MYEQMATLLQHVREFVEKGEPSCKVVAIDGYSTARYEPAPHALGEEPEYELHSPPSFIFRVRAEAPSTELTLEVTLLEDGQLLVTQDPTVTRNLLAGRRGAINHLFS